MPLINKRILLIGLLGAFLSCSVSARSLFSSVQIHALPNLGIDNLGIESDIPTDIWEKSNTKSLKALIKEIVAKPLTPAMQDVMIKMMMCQTSPKATLPLIFRMETLMHLGRFNEVLTLVELVPPSHQTPDILMLKAQALFMLGQTQKACDLMVKTPELSQMAEEMRLACAIARGDKTGAELIFATRSENNELDEVSAALAKKVFFNDELSLDGEKIKVRHLHLLAATGHHIDWSKMILPTTYQKTLSDLDMIPLNIRIEMAERAHVERVEELYAKVDDKTEKNNAVMRAYLYQKMKKITNEDELVSVINKYLDLAKKDGLFFNLAPIIQPVLNTISPSEKTKDVAFNAVQVSALSGNADLAYAWYQVLQKSSDDTSKMQGVFLEPLMHQLGAGIPKEVDKGLLFCQKNASPYCTAYLNKIGADVEVNDWSDVLKNMPISTNYIPLIQSALHGLIVSGRQGEAMLYAIKLWQESVGIEPHILVALSEISPKSLTHRLILERYVYP